MLTPQEVSTHAFSKAVMGGYNMAMVDEFLDELTDDYTALYKENAALKAKMKVLVDKVEDYRATEDSMRATLLTAQKMADSIVKEAEEKRNHMFATIEQETRNRVDQARAEAAGEQEKLRQGKMDLARFIAQSRKVCNEQLALLELLPDTDAGMQDQKTIQVANEIEQNMDAAVQLDIPITQPTESSIYEQERQPPAPPISTESVAPTNTQAQDALAATQELPNILEAAPILTAAGDIQSKDLNDSLLFGANYGRTQ